MTILAIGIYSGLSLAKAGAVAFLCVGALVFSFWIAMRWIRWIRKARQLYKVHGDAKEATLDLMRKVCGSCSDCEGCPVFDWCSGKTNRLSNALCECPHQLAMKKEFNWNSFLGALNCVVERLNEVFQNIHRFTSDLSHQMRTSLSAIHSVGEIALRKKRSVEEYEETIGTMLEETERLEQMVSELLHCLSSNSKNQGEVELFQLDHLLSDVICLFNPLAEEKNISIFTDMTPIGIRAKKELLKSTFQNLIANAIQYSPHGSKISISMQRDKEWIKVTVSDNGPGIRPEEQTKIFNRFYRGSSAKNSGFGFGLGLAIAREAVLVSKGKIWVESEMGKGSSFIVMLPFAGSNK